MSGSNGICRSVFLSFSHSALPPPWTTTRRRRWVLFRQVLKVSDITRDGLVRIFGDSDTALFLFAATLHIVRESFLGLHRSRCSSRRLSKEAAGNLINDWCPIAIGTYSIDLVYSSTSRAAARPRSVRYSLIGLK
ncbi:hypothetical protein BDZ89DRAFT_121368 [Hymenopellis radicata]|nr:hypothetical protein BDZ89DRAFT_121368 [Hymenopellis radicata]